VIDKNKKVVFSLANNSCVHDARVLKQAAALSEAGHDVTIYARTGPEVNVRESRDGFKIVRFDCYSLLVNGKSASFEEAINIFQDCEPIVRSAFAAAEENAAKMLREKAERDATARAERLKAAAEARAAEREARLQRAREARIQAKERQSSSARQPGRSTARASTQVSFPPNKTLVGALWGLKTRLMVRTRAKRAIKNVLSMPRHLARWARTTRNVAVPETSADLQAVGVPAPVTVENMRKADVAPVASTTHADIPPLATAPSQIGHRIRPVDDGMFYLRYFLYAYHIAALSLDSRPDIIHAHDLYTLPAAILLARRTGAKVIFDAHEIETERIPPLPAEKKDFIDRLERSLFRETDAIVVCCESSADFYGERLQKDRPSVVMNAPVLSTTKEADVCSLEVIDRLRSEGEAEIIIYTGGVGREARGLHIAAAALAHLPNAHLIILGPRHPANDEWLMGEASSLGVSDRLHLIPPVSHSEVVDSVKKADVGICLIQDASLSYRYAMPNKLFEMAFAGLPLCVSELPEMGRFVRELDAGVTVDQTNPRAVAQAIRHLMDHRDQYVLGENGKEILMDKYSWPAQKRVLWGLYGRLLSHA
jgi:glycosyltransferase involved in cell wall biosynthesis